MIINGGEFLFFNWDSNSFKLDIENFDIFYLKGLEEFRKNNVDICKQNLEYIINLYRGDLANGFGGLWIESFRGEYFQKYKNAVELLLKIYKQEKNKDDSTKLINKLGTIYPDYKNCISLAIN